MGGSVVKAVFGGMKRVKTRPIYQYDYGMRLMFEGLSLPETYQVHQSNSETGEAKSTLGGADGAQILDEYLLSGENVFAWVFLHDGTSDGYTRYVVEIPVKKRARPVDEEPTPVQQDIITQAIAALNDGVARAEGAADSADESAILSESWAVGGTGTRSGEDTDNAKHYAELAAQSADTAGYAYFDIDETTGEMIVTVANNLDNDLLFQINEAVGELEVVLR